MRLPGEFAVPLSRDLTRLGRHRRMGLHGGRTGISTPPSEIPLLLMAKLYIWAASCVSHWTANIRGIMDNVNYFSHI